MNWTVTFFPTFFKDMAKLPRGIRNRVDHFVNAELPAATNPFALGRLEKLQGTRDFYKVRFGDYRLGLRVDQKNRVIEVRRVLPRRDMYRHFP